MKLSIILSIFILNNLSLIFAQNDEEIFKQTRLQFKTINDEIKTYTTLSDDSTIVESGTDQIIIAYYKGKQLMKIEKNYLGDMAESSFQYYFWNQQLFFVFTTFTYHSYNDGNEQTVTNENRFYFNDNKLIRWLDSGKKQKDKNSADFKNEENNWIENAKKLLDKYKKKDD